MPRLLWLAAALSLPFIAACAPDASTDTDAGTDTDASTDTDAGTDTDAAMDAAPVVISSFPSDGATGFAANQLLSVTFSKPMDIGSVESSFETETLPSVNLSWNNEHTVMNISPVGGLEEVMGVGFDPSLVEGVEYEFTIAATATDKAGTPLAADYAVSFSMQKIMHAQLKTFDTSLTRTMNSTGVVHSSGHAMVFVGDSEVSANTQMKAFLTLDMSEMPEGVEVTDAELWANQVEINGNPYALLGSLTLDHLRFAAVNQDAFDAAALESLGVFSPNQNLGIKSLDVTSAFQDDYDNRLTNGDLSQYRLSFAVSHDTNSQGNSAVFQKDTLRLQVTYLAD